MSASVRVEKATSDLLIGPDWTMNIEICDSINNNPGDAKDVVKAVKKRMQHKNPNVQMLTLILLETMVKNCGDYVHFQIAEKNVLQDMTKIVKKNAHMRIREKILVLLDSWQEAFGGSGGKHAQYYWACEDLRRSGITFPQRCADAAPIFTPPVSHPPLQLPPVGYGMPIHSAKRLDEAMASDRDNLSPSGLDSMQSIADLLSEMLQNVNPNDCLALKDELIVDLVQQCRANQRKLMQLLTSIGDEELLGRGLELNDNLQSLLAKHDALASGSPLPCQVTELTPSAPSSPDEGESSSRPPTSIPVTSPPFASASKDTGVAQEEVEDDFDQLARRHSKTRTSPSCKNDEIRSSGNALAIMDPPPAAPISSTKEKDMIDLLSIALSNQGTPSSSSSPLPNTDTDTYVAPWAHTQTDLPCPESKVDSRYYPPPPWAATPGYAAPTRPSQLKTFASAGPAMQKPFVPSNRLFEDLNVLDGREKGRKK